MAQAKNESVSDDDFIDADDSSDDVEIEASGDTDTVISDEAYSLAAKNKTREELARQIEEFLARGGQINTVNPNVTSDPPRKPSSAYGSHPI